MKNILLLLFTFFAACSAGGKDIVYTGSTPAGKEVRLFLGIPLTDSIDFIRWKLGINDRGYNLSCQYGIGKPNTNGFVNGGRQIAISGKYKQEGNLYVLHQEKHALAFLQIDGHLLQVLDSENQLLAGTGGWSYTLNRVDAVAITQLSVLEPALLFPATFTMVGRTPCFDNDGKNCYKRKWKFDFTYDVVNKQTAGFVMKGTAVRVMELLKGDWQIVPAINGRKLIQLDAAGHRWFIWPVSKDVYFFTDPNGMLLKGNEDFSFTLNRVQEKRRD